MSTWQIILLVFLFFLVSLFFSFSRKPSKKRMVMRLVSVVLFIFIVVVGYMFTEMFKEAKKCPDSGKYFYENKGELCYSSLNINGYIKDKLKIDVNKFVIIDNNSAIFNTINNAQYSLSYDDADGMKIRPLN